MTPESAKVGRSPSAAATRKRMNNKFNQLRSRAGWRTFARRAPVLGLLLLLAAAACSGGKKEAPPPPPVPVSAAPVAAKTVPVNIKAIGNVQAYSTVAVKSQVEGVITKVHFRDGQDVKAGEMLFTIDPRPFEAELRQAQANLAKDRALWENAKKEAERYATLIKQDLVSRTEYDRLATAAASQEAIVRADEAAVENARLKLDYAFIRSPLDGRVGDILVHQGNLVKANDEKNVMVNINQITPIYVAFAVPEQQLATIKRAMAQRKLTVSAVIPQEDQQPQGVLTFVDNAVDPATGTIQLKATFSNTDRILWPGQFVTVYLTLTMQEGARVIPSPALQTGQEGPFVYVVKPDRTVEVRSVVIDRVINGETVIKEGLAPGEEVVTDGQLRLYPGAAVEVKPAAGEGGKPGKVS